MGWGVAAWNLAFVCLGLEPSFFCHMTDLSCQSQSQYVIRAVWFGHGRWDTVVSSFSKFN